MGSPRILIAGAGIGGIVAALALLQRGFEVALYEQAAELRELGAGVQISPNGSRVLCELGLQPALEAIASVPTAKEMRLFNTGQAWRVQDLGANAVSRYGSPYWLVHRGDFHRALVEALAERAPAAVHVGAHCIGFEQNATGVTLKLASGECVRGDALIGADGVHSQIREGAIWRRTRHVHRLHGMARRGADGAPARTAPPAIRHDLDRPARPYRHLPAAPRRTAELRHRDRTRRLADRKLVRGRHGGGVPPDFARWHEDVLAIVDAIDIPYKWAMLGREPLPHWSVGRVSLIGDACHPTLPFLAQGANMAIEDGMVLARCLEAYSDVAEALHRYETARLDRTSRIVRGSLENVSRYHNPQLADPVQAQAFMEREFAPRAMGARYDWLYEYDGRTVPV